MSVPLDESARERGRQRALDARRERARVKQAVRAGAMSVADVLARRDSDDVVARMRVVDLVVAVPGIGPARAERVLDDCHIARTRRLAGLGDHQVKALIARVSPGSAT